jgi:hypothetical protein
MESRPAYQTEAPNVVLPLFGDLEEIQDPLECLIQEGEFEPELFLEEEESPLLVVGMQEPLLVTANLFPEQALYILEGQIAQIRDSMKRLKFYLDDLDDLIPR